MLSPAETSAKVIDPPVEERAIACVDVNSALLADVILPEADSATSALGLEIKFPVNSSKFKLPSTETSNAAGAVRASVVSLSNTVTFSSDTSPVAFKSKSRLSLAKLLRASVSKVRLDEDCVNSTFVPLVAKPLIVS